MIPLESTIASSGVMEPLRVYQPDTLHFVKLQQLLEYLNT